MKVKTLKRSSGASVARECSGDLRRTSRNLNPVYHPMQRAREYTRAVAAAKMERMFAQPLLLPSHTRRANNMGHADAVTCSAVSRTALVPLVSGAADGSVKLWDLATQSAVAEISNAHARALTGVAFDRTGQKFYSCSDDGTLHQWPLHANNTDSASAACQNTHIPLSTWRCGGSFKSMDQSWTDNDRFATASDEAVQVWSCERSTAVQTHSDLWGSSDTVTTVRFHPVEGHLLAHCGADRGIGLHDTRMGKALKKTILAMRSNDFRWNPMEPMNFVVANEDYNAYVFDMRRLDQPRRMYKGHTAAVLSVAWSPTGREFCTGSYDRTMRIFSERAGTARDIYHTKRMQRVFTVNYSLDSKFIVSGSDEGNVRVWKANASEALGQRTARETAAMDYRSALVKRYQHLPEVQRISKTRKIPKVIKNQTAQMHIQKESANRKQANRVKYADKKLPPSEKPKFVSEKQKAVVKQVD